MILSNTSRRHFLAQAGGAMALSAIVAAAQPRIRCGYTAMTWGKEERKAIDEIATAGFEGIQFRIDAVTDFKPAELRSLLAERNLTFVALSSGEVSIDPAVELETIAKHTANASFVKDAGGLYLQVLDQLKPYPRTVSPEECRRLGGLLTEIGKRTADLGVPLAWHNHMNTIGEHPANVDAVLENSDPGYVKLLLDTAHSVAGGGDPTGAIRKYRDRIAFVHLKDMVDIPVDTPGAKYPFKFVELGRGRVNLAAVFSALSETHFQGWAVVELDRVPDQASTPLQSAIISRTFLKDHKFGT